MPTTTRSSGPSGVAAVTSLTGRPSWAATSRASVVTPGPTRLSAVDAHAAQKRARRSCPSAQASSPSTSRSAWWHVAQRASSPQRRHASERPGAEALEHDHHRDRLVAGQGGARRLQGRGASAPSWGSPPRRSTTTTAGPPPGDPGPTAIARRRPSSAGEGIVDASQSGAPSRAAPLARMVAAS